MSNTALLLIVGGILVVVGVLMSGGGRDASTRVGNIGFSVFGSVKQTVHNVGMAINGKRERTPRDWIGWSISATGLVVSLIAFFRD
jgi:hypothetical protein